jgi:hypothetical protein
MIAKHTSAAHVDERPTSQYAQSRQDPPLSTMAGRQHTFELIPTTLVRSTGQKPPMTSKAAKKAHQKANQGPRISRAEQRRLQAEELARQKQEDERERNARKAKAARERRAQMEQAQRVARKKMGLPEPNKFVRASQPTISRFVINGAKRSWQEMHEVTEEPESSIYEQENDNYLPTKRAAVGDTSEEDFGEFPSFSQSDLPGLLHSIDGPTKPLKGQSEGSQELPQSRAAVNEDKHTLDDEQVVAEMITAQLLSEAAEATSRLDDPQSVQKSSSPSNTISVFVDRESTPHMETLEQKGQTPLGISRRALEERSMNMPPPAIITIAKRFAPPSPKPGNATDATIQKNVPPSATQLFLENHLADFFPSPSQEIQELLEKVDDLPPNSQITRELNPDKHIDEDIYVGMFSSQDFILSSQDILEITSPSIVPQKRDDVCLPATDEKCRFFEEKEEDLLHAAIHESIVTAERESKQKVPIQKPCRPTKKSLQRIQSTATDYGDEEFSACVKDLLALF